MHGGTSRVGVESTAFRNGRRAFRDRLPTRYLAAFEEAARDPNLISIRRQMALCDARQVELLSRFEESGATWAEVRDALFGVQNGTTDIATVIALVDRGEADRAAWDELTSLFETRRKLSSTEQRRIESMQAYMTAEEIGVAAGYCAAVLKEFIRDPADLRAAGQRMSEFFSVWRDTSNTTSPRSPRSPEGGRPSAGVRSRSSNLVRSENRCPEGNLKTLSGGVFDRGEHVASPEHKLDVTVTVTETETVVDAEVVSGNGHCPESDTDS